MATNKKPVEEYSLLGIRVDDYPAQVGASINYEVHYTRWLDDQTRVYRFDSLIELSSICTYPEERAGDTYYITVYGNPLGYRDLDGRLKKYHVMGKDGFPKYRKVRGDSFAVYEIPKGIGFLDKTRGKPKWHAAIWVTEQTSSQMLTLLSNQRALYLSIDECKIQRVRWVRGLTLQTADPAEE